MSAYSGHDVLVNEIWDHVCSYLTPPNLARLSLVSRRLNEIALPRKYKSLRLEPFGPSVERFINIAKSPQLRNIVREITIDTRVDFDFEYACNSEYPVPITFMCAIPHLRLFTNVTALHIRFVEECGEGDRDDCGISMEETWEFRYGILDTVMHCAAGQWTLEKQRAIDSLFLGTGVCDLEEFDYSDQNSDFTNRGPFPLRELTITNLADYDDDYLTSSEAWNAIISLPTLIDLKLMIATEKNNHSPGRAIKYEEKYYFFQNIHKTWLSPNLSQHLRVLSLYFGDYWGWLPKMDFRLIGEESPFPQLKILALGNYVFSHEWQIEWFSKIGKENGSGGLKELYLDDCPMLFQASQCGVSDDRYPDFKRILEDQCSSETYSYPTRWHHVLVHWKDSMKGLEVLKMGSGSWYLAPWDAHQTILNDLDYADTCSQKLEHRLSGNQHRHFASPAPASDDEKDGDEWESKKWRNGTGLSDTRCTRMQYIEYDIGTGPSPWLEKTGDYCFPNGFEPEDGTLIQDDLAWEEMIAANQTRREARNGRTACF
ncbi:hypothetical protein FHETE_7225 [Fusarium heterosporum]|uniref:F-box domain-containing protein n=1 Tax=Fusarium heterosporum TaxID=42747 RepID=A0A8H5T700_FUSHE|nr:hypothetical protein FHETE_7225 [Fusarium heterosporum]